METAKRMERKIERIPFCGCWIWTGSTTAGRYGSVYHNGKVRRAHRVALELSGVDVPDGAEVMHSCDVGFCVNPDHLSIGTHQDNMSDMKAKGRARSPAGDAHWTRAYPEKAKSVAQKNIANAHGRGEQNGNAKVSLLMLNQIRSEYRKNPSQTMADLGIKYGIGRETARKIIKGVAPWTF